MQTNVAYATNRTLAEQYADALEEYARAKSSAGELERKTKRIWAQCFLMAEGKNVEERKARAQTSSQYTTAEDRLIQAETAANIAKAMADGLAARFEAWRTEQSTRRAEMNIR